VFRSPRHPAAFPGTFRSENSLYLAITARCPLRGHARALFTAGFSFRAPEALLDLSVARHGRPVARTRVGEA